MNPEIATLIVTVLGGMFVIAILFLRPQQDPVTLVIGLIAAFAAMKTRETHFAVNSQLEKAKAEEAKVAKLAEEKALLVAATQSQLAKAEGIAQGTLQEQARTGKEGPK